MLLTFPDHEPVALLTDLIDLFEESPFTRWYERLGHAQESIALLSYSDLWEGVSVMTIDDFVEFLDYAQANSLHLPNLLKKSFMWCWLGQMAVNNTEFWQRNEHLLTVPDPTQTIHLGQDNEYTTHTFKRYDMGHYDTPEIPQARQLNLAFIGDLPVARRTVFLAALLKSPAWCKAVVESPEVFPHAIKLPEMQWAMRWLYILECSSEPGDALLPIIPHTIDRAINTMLCRNVTEDSPFRATNPPCQLAGLRGIAHHQRDRLIAHLGFDPAILKGFERTAITGSTMAACIVRSPLESLHDCEIRKDNVISDPIVLCYTHAQAGPNQITYEQYLAEFYSDADIDIITELPLEETAHALCDALGGIEFTQVNERYQFIMVYGKSTQSDCSKPTQRKKIDVFHSRSIARTVGAFHVGAVRAFYLLSEQRAYCYPSFLSTVFTGINCDVRSVGDGEAQNRIVIKYTHRGYQFDQHMHILLAELWNYRSQRHDSGVPDYCFTYNAAHFGVGPFKGKQYDAHPRRWVDYHEHVPNMTIYYL